MKMRGSGYLTGYKNNYFFKSILKDIAFTPLIEFKERKTSRTGTFRLCRDASMMGLSLKESFSILFPHYLSICVQQFGLINSISKVINSVKVISLQWDPIKKVYPNIFPSSAQIQSEKEKEVFIHRRYFLTFVYLFSNFICHNTSFPLDIIYFFFFFPGKKGPIHENFKKMSLFN